MYDFFFFFPKCGHCLLPKLRILCDVPCTALGLRPRFSYEGCCAKSIQSTAAYQRQFLETAFRLAKKPGGEIVYSTCSITLAENEQVVAGFLSDHREEVSESIQPTLISLSLSFPKPQLRLCVCAHRVVSSTGRGGSTHSISSILGRAGGRPRWKSCRDVPAIHASELVFRHNRHVRCQVQSRGLRGEVRPREPMDAIPKATGVAMERDERGRCDCDPIVILLLLFLLFFFFSSLLLSLLLFF